MTRRLIASIAVAFALLQLVPYRPSNPPVRQEPAWDSPETRALAVRACFDCHSNEVRIPWYGRIAPTSWIVADHIDEGRAVLNLSEMDRPQPEAHESSEAIAEGEMPPAWYVALHPDAALSDAERSALMRGLDATLGGEGGEGGDGGGGGEGGRGGEGHEDDDHDDD